jgi:hypothetical protein
VITSKVEVNILVRTHQATLTNLQKLKKNKRKN